MARAIHRYHVYFDDGDPACAGWVAEYFDAAGELVTDSEKVWHPAMPTDPDAEDDARAIAEAYARCPDEP